MKALFNAVCDLPDAAARQRVLAELQASSTEAAKVHALLAEDAKTSAAATARLTAAVAELTQELHAGDRLGAYTLLRPLGQGGMGQVLLAERSDGHYEQHVAIKLLLGSTGPDAETLLARERQILAQLTHPNIARLLDGGTTPRGHPYLVMEYIQGERLDEHLRAADPSLVERLRLFGEICAAVAHAHHHLVVHCDLKPANVLVDRDGRAMLLDFGVARLQGHEVAAGLTPHYASPELRAGEPATVSSDIYSLGRMLAELVPPDAPRRREWTAIVDKASAPRPENRYASVSELQAELRRFSQHFPLAALRNDRAYRLVKTLRRRWPWWLAGVASAAVASAFTVSLVHQRDRAEREAATTKAVSDMLVSLFEGADPTRHGRPDLSARELVDRAQTRVRAALRAHPEQQGPMLAVLGQVNANLGRTLEARRLLQEALATPSLSDNDARASWLTRLSLLLSDASDGAAAVAPARQAVELLQRARSANMPAMAAAQEALGVALTRIGEFAQAREALDGVLRTRRQRARVEPMALADTLRRVGQLARIEGRPDDAVVPLEEALTLRRRHLTPDDASLFEAQLSLGGALADAGRYEAALPLLRAALEGRRRLLGPDSDLVSDALTEMGAALQDSGHLDEARAALREALRIDTHINGRRHVTTSVSMNNLASVLEDAGDPEAETLYRESLSVREEVQAGDTLAVAQSRSNLGTYLLRRGRLAEAGPLLAAALAARATLLPAGHEKLLQSRLRVAELALRQGRAREADADIARVGEYIRSPATSSWRVRAEAERLLALRAELVGDKPGMVAHARASSRLYVEHLADLPATLFARLDEVAWLIKAGERDAACERLEALADARRTQHPLSHWRATADRLRRSCNGKRHPS
ncbi:MAG TPA: serine/threonine-protein kinase [Roseateles sp.]